MANIEEIKNLFISSENVELEIRFYLNSADQWKQVYQSIIKNNPDVADKTQQTVDIAISQKKNRDRQELHFNKGVKTSVVYTRKTVLAEKMLMHEKQSYKVALAQEISIPKFDSSGYDKIRIKLRSSLFMPENITDLQGWRLDFTYVKSLNPAQSQTLQKVKNEIFKLDKEITKDNFIEYVENLPYSETDAQSSYEFEAEYIGNKNEVNIEQASQYVLNTLLLTRNNTGYQDTIYQIAKIFKHGAELESYKYKYGLKQFVNQPRNFDLNDYVNKILVNVENYYLSDKADGHRGLLWLSPDKITLLTSHHDFNITTQVKKLFVDNLELAAIADCIFDVEILDLDIEHKTFDKIYLFDVLMFNGEKTTQKNFSEREKLLSKVKASNIEKKIQIPLSKDKYGQQITDLYKRSSRLYPIDGLIFTPAAEPYFSMMVYKWKPPNQVSIDFLAVKAPANLIGVKPYLPKNNHELYFLFCGIRYELRKLLNIDPLTGYSEIFSKYKIKQDLSPIQFSPTINPYAYLYYHPDNSEFKEEQINNHVIEFGYDCSQAKVDELDDLTKCKWFIVKPRPDRDIEVEMGTGYGNNFRTAEVHYQSYLNPITLEMLTTINENNLPSYFKTTKSEMYKPLVKFNSFVKAQILRQCENSDWLIDLAAGKGQDLFVYNGFGIRNYLGVDQDKVAIAELNNRKYSLDDERFYVYTRRPHKHMSVRALVMDLTHDYKENLERIKDVVPSSKNANPENVDVVVINLAIHYIVKSEPDLLNLFNLVNALLKPGGLFIFTCFNGQSIFNLLKDVDYNEKWEIKEDNVAKYSIIKKYKEKVFENFGQTISLVHPFSSNEYYEEDLINIPHLIEFWQSKKYKLRQQASFGNWLDKYKSYNKKMYDLLKDDDKLYASLYCYVSLFKPL